MKSDRSLAKARQGIQNDPGISDGTKRYLFEFLSVLAAEGLKKETLIDYALNLQALAKRFPPKGFLYVERRDLQQLICLLQELGYSPRTITHHKMRLLRFQRWLREEHGYPNDYPDSRWAGKRLEPGEKPVEFRGIKMCMKYSLAYKPEELPTQEDVSKMIDAAIGSRDRALVAVLYESGARLSEFLGMTIGAVKHTPYGWKVYVDGKTGTRPIMLINAGPYLTAWLSLHPFRDDPAAPLWISTGSRRNALARFERTGELLCLDKSSIPAILQNLAERAKIRKRVNPHAFRHARATELARHLKEAELRSFMGWAPGSPMPGVYVHLSARDTESALLKAHGIEPTESSRTLNQCRACPACAEQTPRAENFCLKCGHPMDLPTGQRADKAMQQLGQALPGILENKKALRDFRRLLTKHKIAGQGIHAEKPAGALPVAIGSG